MSKSELKDRIIKNFLGVVSKDKDIDLTNFYEKLDTLEVIVGKKNSFIASYDCSENKLYLENESCIDKTIYHELFHCASSKMNDNTNYSGFMIWNANTFEIKGLGLNEGYTELLNQRYFKQGHGYAVEVFYMSRLEQIVNPVILKKLYFAHDLEGLIKELSKYAELEDINEFINCLDTWTYTTSKHRKYNPELQDCITTCSKFLSQCYVQKLINENASDMRKKAIDYLNSFIRISKSDSGNEFYLDVPHDLGNPLLEKISKIQDKGSK